MNLLRSSNRSPHQGRNGLNESNSATGYQTHNSKEQYPDSLPYFIWKIQFPSVNKKRSPILFLHWAYVFIMIACISLSSHSVWQEERSTYSRSSANFHLSDGTAGFPRLQNPKPVSHPQLFPFFPLQVNVHWLGLSHLSELPAQVTPNLLTLCCGEALPPWPPLHTQPWALLLKLIALLQAPCSSQVPFQLLKVSS